MHNTVGFNESQSKAISKNQGPMLVIAGPGSGKTLVITHRINNLIKEYNVKPENILVITFTKAAAVEMQYRFYALAGALAAPVNFGTCHAIFFQIIKDATALSGANIIKEIEKREIMEEILSNPNKDKSFILDPSIESVYKMLSEISKIKNFGISPENYECTYCSKEEFLYIYNTYINECNIRRKIDFDDMLLKCLMILKSNKPILEKYQNLYQYILIDEFQDVNPVQYEIIKLLASKNKNVFVVGDDDQSIYGFRGSTPNIMKKFLEDFEPANIVELDVNYRSKKDIVDTSIRLINNNENRFLKNPKATKQGNRCVKYFSYETRPEQYEGVALAIEEYMKQENTHYEDIAVLYRTNGHTSMLLTELLRKNIPFKCKEKVQNIFETDVGKDMRAYLEFALDEKNVNAFFRIMNKPSRYIRRNSIPVRNFSRINLMNEIESKDVLHKVIHFFTQIDFIKKLEPYPAINFIRKGIGYDYYLEEYARNTNKDINELMDILEELTQGAKQFNSIKEWLRFAKSYEEIITSNTKPINNKSFDNKGINILTMHGSKGLEWPLVILPDLNEGMVPHKKARTTEAIEEERRIFYVAMTRAKDYLLFFFVKSKRADLVSQPSRFLSECNDLKMK